MDQLSLGLAGDPGLSACPRPGSATKRGAMLRHGQGAGAADAGCTDWRLTALGRAAGAAGPETARPAAPQTLTERAPTRADLVARWLELSRGVLPAMARQGGWRLRHDHCFMRVCLDTAVGGRWDLAFPAPAIRRAPAGVLARAVAVAERIAADPGCLGPLDAASRAWRRDDRAR